MDKVVGVGIELAGDFAVLSEYPRYQSPEREYELIAASVVGPDIAVRKFEADVVSGWMNPETCRYIWDGRVIRMGSGGHWHLIRSRVGHLTHGVVVSRRCLWRVEEDDRYGDILLALDGDLEREFGAWLRERTDIPFLSEWLPVILQRATQMELLDPLETIGRAGVRAARFRGQKQHAKHLEAVIRDLIREGRIRIPEGRGPNGQSPKDLDLDGYLTSWGPALAGRLQEARKPLWVPGDGQRGTEIADLKEPLFEPQADTVEGLARSLRYRKGVILCGAMGTGKTRMGAAIAHRLFGHKGGYRVLVQCPGHLVRKWVREVEAVIPAAQVRIVRSGVEMLGLLRGMRGGKPRRPEFYVVGRETAKLGWVYRPGAVWDAHRKVRVKRDLGQSEMVPDPVWRCPRCGGILKDQVKIDDGETVGIPFGPDAFKGRKSSNLTCSNCKEPLWQPDGKRVRRVSVARAVRAKGHGLFDVLLADEAHELKGGGTAQGVALGELATECRKVVLLTGTLFGGMALDIFFLLWRIAPGQMIADGQAWTDPSRWVRRYGRYEKLIDDGRDDHLQNRASRSALRSQPVMRPGISPTLYGRHLVDAAAFVDLEDVAPWLPEYREVPDPVDLSEVLKRGYQHLESELEMAARSAAQAGDMSIFAKWIQTALGWPDKPADWPVQLDREGGVICVPPVVQPEQDGLYPKERRLLEVLEHERQLGRRVAIFQTFTGRHDMLTRLEEITRARGFRPAILRAEVVKPELREEWITQRVKTGADLLICHPKVVETGLDLWDFPTVVWLQTGTSLFPVRQASRRPYRIGQKLPVEVRFLAYSDTLQTAMLMLMADKLRAASAAEGHVTAEGLQVLAGAEDSSLALAQALVRGLDGVTAAEEVWRQAARLAPVDGKQPAAAEKKIRTLLDVLPVTAVAPKARRGRAVAEGVMQLALDFDRVANGGREGSRWRGTGPSRSPSSPVTVEVTRTVPRQPCETSSAGSRGIRRPPPR